MTLCQLILSPTCPPHQPRWSKQEGLLACFEHAYTEAGGLRKKNLTQVYSTGNSFYGKVTKVPLSQTSPLVTRGAQVAQRPNGSVPESLPEHIDLCLSRLSVCMEAARTKIKCMMRLVYHVAEKPYSDESALEVFKEKLSVWLTGRRSASLFLTVKRLSE